MKLCNYCFETSEQLIIPVSYAMQFVLKVDLSLFCPGSISESPYFCLISRRLSALACRSEWIKLVPWIVSVFILKQRQLSWLHKCLNIFFSLQFSIFFWITRPWYCLVCTQGNQEISWKKFDQYYIIPLDIDAGFVINSAYATGSFDNKTVTSNSDTAIATAFGPNWIY